MIKNITSVNVRGLQSNLKRKEIAAELSTLDRDIYFLQETHSIKSCERFWHKDFKMTNAFYSHGTSAARGVAIMLNLKEDFELTKINNLESITDINGRLVGIAIKFQGNKIGLVNCYAPNLNATIEKRNEYLQYLTALDNTLDELETLCDYIIVGGDFNLILDEALDAKGGSPSVFEDCVEYLTDICGRHNLEEE